MLQPASVLPEVPMKPAPWTLTGQAWLVALRLPAQAPARSAFLPGGLAGKASGISLLAFVDYESSDCGPYHEIMFIPGSVPFADGRRHMTISRILVSTWDSVVNGRANWGIPKDRADFDVHYGAPGGEDHFVVRSDGRVMAELRLKAWPLSLPVFGGFIPASMRTLAQQFDGRTFLYAPSSRGWMQPGKLMSWQFDDALFPDLSGAQVLGAARLRPFRMTFPVARMLASN